MAVDTIKKKTTSQTGVKKMCPAISPRSRQHLGGRARFAEHLAIQGRLSRSVRFGSASVRACGSDRIPEAIFSGQLRWQERSDKSETSSFWNFIINVWGQWKWSFCKKMWKHIMTTLDIVRWVGNPRCFKVARPSWRAAPLLICWCGNVRNSNDWVFSHWYFTDSPRCTWEFQNFLDLAQCFTPNHEQFNTPKRVKLDQKRVWFMAFMALATVHRHPSKNPCRPLAPSTCTSTCEAIPAARYLSPQWSAAKGHPGCHMERTRWQGPKKTGVLHGPPSNLQVEPDKNTLNLFKFSES